MDAALDDVVVQQLARLFLRHPAWIEAGGRIREGASSAVFFRHLPGQAFELLREGGESRLRAGYPPDPDFAFRFSPAAVARLEAVQGGASELAIELFERMLDPDPAAGVELRVVAPMTRLVRRGYLGLLLAAGPELVAFGARQGVGGLSELRALVGRMRARCPEPWETERAPGGEAP